RKGVRPIRSEDTASRKRIGPSAPRGLLIRRRGCKVRASLPGPRRRRACLFLGGWGTTGCAREEGRPMSSLLTAPGFLGQAALRRFSVDEYHRMTQIGLLDEYDNVELLEGYVVLKMPRNPP